MSSVLAQTIKKRVIKKLLLQQEDSIKSRIPNMLLAAEHVDTEDSYSILAMFFPGLIFLYALAVLFSDNDWVGFLVLSLIGTIIIYLSDAIIFYIRRTAGFIQGAVLFDPQKKRIYAFPSITSAYCNEYHESQLIYTIESDSKRDELSIAFFTRKENGFAFKVKNLKGNNFKSILSQTEPVDMFIPNKYQFHEMAACIIGLIGVFVFWVIEAVCILPILKSCNLILH